MAFDEALRLQLAAREDLVADRGPPTLFLVEHPAVVTVGRRGRRDDVLWTDDELAAAGMSIADSPRGGELTLHAPGQLVAYPVVHVGRRIRGHLLDLAGATIDLLEELGVSGSEFRLEHPGVWIGDGKIASIGIHISRGVAVQGLSMNLAVEPSLFAALVSCGMRDVRMLNVRDFGVETPSVADAARRWADHYAVRAGFSLG
jgi:lipoate-protein ligase B